MQKKTSAFVQIQPAVLPSSQVGNLTKKTSHPSSSACSTTTAWSLTSRGVRFVRCRCRSPPPSPPSSAPCLCADCSTTRHPSWTACHTGPRPRPRHPTLRHCNLLLLPVPPLRLLRGATRSHDGASSARAHAVAGVARARRAELPSFVLDACRGRRGLGQITARERRIRVAGRAGRCRGRGERGPPSRGAAR